MNEPSEITAEQALRESSHGLFLTRVFATVAALVLGLPCLLAGLIAKKFGIMLAEIGAELPVISQLIVKLPAVWVIGAMVLIGVTLFFIWAKGRAAPLMAGAGLLLLAVLLPSIVFAMFLPLIKIVSEMGNM